MQYVLKWRLNARRRVPLSLVFDASFVICLDFVLGLGVWPGGPSARDTASSATSTCQSSPNSTYTYTQERRGLKWRRILYLSLLLVLIRLRKQPPWLTQCCSNKYILRFYLSLEPFLYPQLNAQLYSPTLPSSHEDTTTKHGVGLRKKLGVMVCKACFLYGLLFLFYDARSLSRVSSQSHALILDRLRWTPCVKVVWG